MDFAAYQTSARATAVYPEDARVIYPALGLANEAGEVLGKIKKIIRDKDGNFGDPESKLAIQHELGDVLWYIAALCSDLELDMQEVAHTNIEKLDDRARRGAIQGDGDKR